MAPDAALARAHSYANETWLGDGFVLRVNCRDDLGRLRREAELAARLPAEARHPGVLACGTDGEIEWLVLPRVAGIELSRAWPEMERGRRERAARELAGALRALHRTGGDMPSDGDPGFAPPHTLPLGPLVELIGRVPSAAVDAGLLDEAEAFVRERWTAFDGDGRGLVHGDPHLENVMWDGEHVSALLDLDWSRRSWLEVDLEILLSFCDHPWLFVAADYEDRALAHSYADVPGWLADEYPEWVAHPRLGDRLAVLQISRAIGMLDEFPPTGQADPSDPRDHRNHLRRVLDGSSPLDHWAKALAPTRPA
jgi:hygromycin-B 7''-O-kinase